MTQWHDLTLASTLSPGEVMEFSWQGEDLLLYRTLAGECQAISAYCPHMHNYIPNGLAPGQPLGALLQHEVVRCPYHGWSFNGKGQCTDIPQGQRVPESVRKGRAIMRSWRIREHGLQIQIAAR